jgi:hypothetical protein
MTPITAETSVAEVIRRCPSARRIFDAHGLKGCGGAHGPTETLAFFASVHQADLDALLGELNRELAQPASERYVYQETLPDFIYRRFFKAGIAIVLSVGALWGATNLLEIALKGSFLQLNLLPAIHAHAHAMIFGWVGLFVMGFAYQSFPRFKNTTLWRPDLANFSFYLMLAGIVSRMAAELLAPDAAAFALAAFSAIVEIAAVAMFVVILVRTARQSIEPRSRYEKFIFGAMFWFVVQAVLSPVFFFAKATAVGQSQLVMRIATIDGPLRDIQLLGFAALIIAGVSQRFVPAVYGLQPPKRDRLSLIFWVMNLSLVLNVASYVLLLHTHNLVFAATLELAYVLMPVWGILLVKQLNLFSHATQPDRTLKYVRAAYGWLVFALLMMPFFPLYGVLTHQVFAHSYMGAHRHAYTVGFISLMIMGVAARVVPILAGVDASRLSPLWGVFILINLGNTGRVVLQILTDFDPHIAYPLVGFTGFIEVTALAWWGIGLWRLMNLSRVNRPQMLASPLPIIAR